MAIDKYSALVGPKKDNYFEKLRTTLMRTRSLKEQCEQDERLQTAVILGHVSNVLR